MSVAVRFEDVTLANDADSPDGTGCSATVTEKMYLGGMFRFETRTADGVALTSDVSNSDAARLVAEGDTVNLAWKSANVSVLLE